MPPDPRSQHHLTGSRSPGPLSPTEGGAGRASGSGVLHFSMVLLFPVDLWGILCYLSWHLCPPPRSNDIRTPTLWLHRLMRQTPRPWAPWTQRSRPPSRHQRFRGAQAAGAGWAGTRMATCVSLGKARSPGPQALVCPEAASLFPFLYLQSSA